VVQNGNAYDEGLDNDFWKPLKAYWQEPKSKQKRDALRKFLTYDATKWQYTHGVKNPELVSPDGAAHDQFLLDRQGNDEIRRLGAPLDLRSHRDGGGHNYVCGIEVEEFTASLRSPRQPSDARCGAGNHDRQPRTVGHDRLGVK
jgi:hypothetical protein